MKVEDLCERTFSFLKLSLFAHNFHDEECSVRNIFTECLAFISLQSIKVNVIFCQNKFAD